jgi:hypothetical protein
MNMATSEQFKNAVTRCADAAIKTQSDPSERARHFIARLSGALDSLGERELADKVFSVLHHGEPL